MDEVERAKTAYRVCFDLADDVTDDELEREVARVLVLAHQGLRRQNLRNEIAKRAIGKRQIPALDISACDKVAGALLEIVNSPRA